MTLPTKGNDTCAQRRVASAVVLDESSPPGPGGRCIGECGLSRQIRATQGAHSATWMNDATSRFGRHPLIRGARGRNIGRLPNASTSRALRARGSWIIHSHSPQWVIRLDPRTPAVCSPCYPASPGWLPTNPPRSPHRLGLWYGGASRYVAAVPLRWNPLSGGTRRSAGGMPSSTVRYCPRVIVLPAYLKLRTWTGREPPLSPCISTQPGLLGWPVAGGRGTRVPWGRLGA